MANYSARFTLTLSDTVKDIAAKVGKGFDHDTAGEYSFTDNGDGTISTSTPCTPEFKAQGDYLMTNPYALFMAMQGAYAERWADLTPPTLAEGQAFIAAIILEPQI
jgi:hypothetical protein